MKKFLASLASAIVGIVVIAGYFLYYNPNLLPMSIQKKFHIGVYSELKCDSPMAKNLLKDIILKQRIEEKKTFMYIFLKQMQKNMQKDKNITSGDVMSTLMIAANPIVSSIYLATYLKEDNATSIEETPLYENAIKESIEELKKNFHISLIQPKQVGQDEQNEAIFCLADLSYGDSTKDDDSSEDELVEGVKYKLQLKNPKIGLYELQILKFGDSGKTQ